MAKENTKSSLKDVMEKIKSPKSESTPKLAKRKPYKMPNVSEETHAPASKSYFKKLKDKLGI